MTRYSLAANYILHWQYPSDSVATRLLHGRSEFDSKKGRKVFSFLRHRVPIDSGAHPASCPMGIGRFLPGIKAIKQEPGWTLELVWCGGDEKDICPYRGSTHSPPPPPVIQPVAWSVHWLSCPGSRESVAPSKKFPSISSKFWSLEQGSKVFSEQLTVNQLVKKFITFYRARRFFTEFTRARHQYLFWDRWIRFKTFSDVCSNIILPSMIMSSKLSLRGRITLKWTLGR
jgi:hypothetical protein